MATGIKITVSDDKKTLTMVAPIDPIVSNSEKSILLVTTGGNMKTGVKYKGQEIVAGINIYVPNDGSLKSKGGGKKKGEEEEECDDDE